MKQLKRNYFIQKKFTKLEIHIKTKAMKKIILLITAALCITSLMAQITITGTDMPQGGKINVVAYDTLGNINLGTTSPNAQNWNFASLASMYYRFASYSSTLPYNYYAPQFSGSNIYTYGPAYLYSSFLGGSSVNRAAWGYMYWKSDNAGFKIVGFRNDNGGGVTNTLESPQELLMGAPATYNSVFPNTAKWKVKFNKVPGGNIDSVYRSVISKTLTCDAFGTLTTPNYTNLDVIRVHELMTTADTVGIEMGGQPVAGYQFLFQKKTVNNYYFWAKNIGYPIATVHCDQNNVILDVEFLTGVQPGFQITGQVLATNGTTPIAEGTVNLLPRDSIDHLFGIDETVPVDNNGHFQFADVATFGNFLVLANPDQTQYPHNISTYYGNSIYWLSAQVLQLSGDANISIACRNDSAYINLTGTSAFTGTIWRDSSVTKGPVHSTSARGVKVTLEQNPGGAVTRHATTDTNGNYNFGNIPAGDYKLRVEVAGVKMDTNAYTPITITTGASKTKDFVYDTLLVRSYSISSIDEHSYQSQYKVSIFPNPFSDAATFVINTAEGKEQEYLLTVYDVTGRTIKTLNGYTSDRIRLTKDGLTIGMYIYDLKVNKQTISTGKIFVN